MSRDSLEANFKEKRDAASQGLISAAVSRVTVRVIRTGEERMIAKTFNSLFSIKAENPASQ